MPPEFICDLPLFRGKTFFRILWNVVKC